MKIQKWLLPNRANKYHPHLLRPVGLSLVLVALLGFNTAQNAVSAHKFQVLGAATGISSSDIISLTNAQRTANGLPGLSTNWQLMAAAQAKAQDMFAEDYWAHDSPSGATPWTFITNAGYSYSTAGENLAKGFSTSDGVVSAWMGSAEHRANILNSSFVDTGVAVMQGTLLGSPTTLVVAEYASPKPAAAPVPAAQPTTPVAPSSSAAAGAGASSQAPASQTPSQAAGAADTSKTNTTKISSTQPPAKDSASAGQTNNLDNTRAIDVRQRTWAQNASLFLLTTVLLVTILKHTVVWRTKKRGWRHIWLRAHPAAQYGLLVVAITANLVSGVGVIR